MEKNVSSASWREHIKAQCGAKVWQRGCELASSRSLGGLVRAGDELFGRFAGSLREPYQLHARLREGQVVEASCSCPFEGGGWCKHRVALALRYAAAPNEFNALPAVREIVEALEREPLNVLVESWVRREPQLLSALALAFNTTNAVNAGDAGADAGLQVALRGALAGRGADEGRVALEMAVNRATQLESAKDWAGAIQVWRILLEEISLAVPHFEAIITGEDDEDYEGDWYREVEEIDTGEAWAALAVAGLERCLNVETLAPELRETILRALWQAWIDTHNSDYFALPEEVTDRVLDDAPPALWSEIEAYLLEQVKTSSRRADYQREYLLGLLAYGLEARGEAARAGHLLRQHGSYRQKLGLLMEEKNYAAAQQLALQNEDAHAPSLLDVAHDLEKAGETERALELAKRARQNASPYRVPLATQWLAQFYMRHNRPADAAREAAALFAARPDAQSLDIWKAAVALDGDWDDWDNRYPRLEKSPAMTAALRVKLAILDGRAARALELWGELSAREQAPFMEDLARVCEADLPAKASELYRQMGENCIAKRGYGDARPHYRAAAAHWKRARELHKKLGTMDDWTAYIRAQRETHKRLPALQDELKKAGL